MKRLYALTAILTLVSPHTLYAQTAPTQNQEITLTVTPTELGVIGTALGELPFKTSAGLLQKLNQQIAKQQQPPAPVTVEPPKPEGK